MGYVQHFYTGYGQLKIIIKLNIEMKYIDLTKKYEIYFMNV